MYDVNAMEEGRKCLLQPFKTQQAVKLDAGNDSVHVLEFVCGKSVIMSRLTVMCAVIPF